MKNKLKRNNLTKFDYVARRLGVFGLFLIIGFLAFSLPVSNLLTKNNETLIREIQHLDNDDIEITVNNTVEEGK